MIYKGNLRKIKDQKMARMFCLFDQSNKVIGERIIKLLTAQHKHARVRLACFEDKIFSKKNALLNILQKF